MTSSRGKKKTKKLSRKPVPAIASKHRPSISPKDYHAHDPNWRIFRIMAEFVEGFTLLGTLEKSVTFFGSARFTRHSKHYQEAEQLGALLGKDGFTIVTGGGPGIMEAGNKGAKKVGAKSIGLNIELPKEQRINPYVTGSLSFHYFFSRKVMLAYSAQAFVFFPGGFGTLNEFYEILTLQQTGKISLEAPIILIGKDYWKPIHEWTKRWMLGEHKAISPEDLNLYYIAKDVNEAYEIIRKTKPSSNEHVG